MPIRCVTDPDETCRFSLHSAYPVMYNNSVRKDGAYGMRDGGHNQIRFRLFLFAAAGAAVMIAIFAFSSNGGEDSSRQSLFFLNTPLGAWILRNLPALFPGDGEMQLRKLAHMFEYCCLAVCEVLFFDELLRRSTRRLTAAAPLALCWCLLYAATDEYHQTFVPGRSGRVSDVLVDLLGSAIGTLGILLILAAGRRILNHYNKNRK